MPGMELGAGIEPSAAGWEARILPLCYAAPKALTSLVVMHLLGGQNIVPI